MTNATRPSIRKLVSLSVETASAVERFRRSGEVFGNPDPRLATFTDSELQNEVVRRQNAGSGSPTESETLRRLIEMGLERFDAIKVAEK